ncbi:protein-glutamine gamma-glutamyltransferase [Pullulanibacillus camelliae]|uniref:Protein-glutamine gamma-glutamyltransferase n=2 Tax=Pullulanibacillus camelliae TaxID=1707096 RepID=A0A8J2VYY7_9BACL|nr:protein-glutamine gamma-glutamyltransferase [Pullulanibacillus camelliae]
MLVIQGQRLTISQAQQLAPALNHSQEIISSMVNNGEVYLFSSELVFRLAVTLRSHIIDSALTLAKSGADFETFYRTKGNPNYWEITEMGGLQLKNNTQPSTGLQDIFNNGSTYGFECATAMEIVLLHGILLSIGEELFNTLYAHLYLWDWQDVPNLPLTIEPVQQGDIPGDVRYFKNPQVSPNHMAFQGENVIVLPNGRYYGHGVGIGDHDYFVTQLNKARRPGATIDAYLMPRATRIVVERLAYLSQSFIQIPQPTLPV